MRIGWIADPAGDFKGGAELSSEELVAAAPDWADIVPCPPGAVSADVDAYVAMNVTQYDASLIPLLAQKRVVKSVRDMWPIGDDELRSWLLDSAVVTIFNSPVHRSWFLYPVNTITEIVPPPMNLEPFREAAQRSKHREGVIWIGAMHRHKGILEATHWARINKELVDFYGGGSAVPRQERYVCYRGPVPYGDVPELMARYEKFLYTPRVLDGFGRTVCEANAAGCALVLGGLVGAKWWLDNDPDALDHGAAMFWQVVWDYIFTGMLSPGWRP